MSCGLDDCLYLGLVSLLYRVFSISGLSNFLACEVASVGATATANAIDLAASLAAHPATTVEEVLRPGRPPEMVRALLE
jgi:hypothetical protein